MEVASVFLIGNLDEDIYMEQSDDCIKSSRLEWV